MAFESPFSADHADRLTVLEVNNDGSKLLTASVDHRVSVYDIDRLTAQRKQLDVWTAHDADIRDAKWLHPSTGTNFVTIGSDLQMRVWSQDTYQAPMSGRRFRRIATIKCDQLVPFVSVDTKTIGSSTYIVVIDRQGLLSLYEPTNPDEYNDWVLIDQFNVSSPTPGRSDHTSFKVQFDPNTFPLPYQASLSDDQDQLAISVSAMNELKLYRSTGDSDIINSQTSSQQHAHISKDASHRLYLYEVLRLQPHLTQQSTSAGSLLRDIAFCPGNFRGTDLLAVASINGSVAVYEISVQSEASPTSQSSATIPKQGQRSGIQAHQSNLTSALHPSPASSNAIQKAQMRTNHPFPYTHTASLISLLQHAHIDAWSVRWDPSGQVLLSSGTDGTVKMWKRAVSQSGFEGFELYAEQAGEEDSDEGSTDEDRDV